MTKVGPTPPVRTRDGWLVVFHGVKEHCNGYVYSLGALLLDLKDPERIVGMTRRPILTPDAPYEVQGLVPNVVFANGFLVDEARDEVRIYYGAADTCIGLATGSLTELLSECKRHRGWD